MVIWYQLYKEKLYVEFEKIGAFMSAVLLMTAVFAGKASASEIDLNIPSLDVSYQIFGYAVTGSQILFYGLGICVLGLILVFTNL